MPITSLEQIRLGIQPPVFFAKQMGQAGVSAGHLISSWQANGFSGTGNPPQQTLPTTGLSGSALNAPINGALAFTNPPAGSASYLARVTVGGQSGGGGLHQGHFMLFDRLWQNGGGNYATITAQTVNSVAWPERDNNGSSNGEGVIIMLESILSAGGANANSNASISYTNSDGVAGRTGNMIVPAAPLLATGSCAFFSLQETDKGVRSVESITTPTALSGSGNYSLVAVRLLCAVPVKIFNKSVAYDALDFGLTRLYNNTVPFFMYMPNGAFSFYPINGSVTYSFG